MNDLKDILTDILDFVERLARGYDEQDIIDDVHKTCIKINNLEVKEDEYELNLTINQDIGLEKVIIIYDDKNGTYDIKAQYLNSQEIDYYIISSNIKDVDTAKLVKDAYIKGLYAGVYFRGKVDE